MTKRAHRVFQILPAIALLIPLLSIAGSNDPDTPTVETTEYNRALRQNDPPRVLKRMLINETGRYQIDGEYIVDTKTGLVKKFTKSGNLGVPFKNMK